MIWPNDYENQIVEGDALTVLKEMPNKVVNMVMTSPPYWGLRDYGVDEQLGLESRPEEYLEKLCVIFDEIKRVLRDDGVIFVNLGDSYISARGRWSSNPQTISGKKNRCEPIGNRPDQREHPIYQDKCMAIIPERFVWNMIERGWILRNKIIWHKSNPMPSSVKDRFSNIWEYIFMFSKSRKYWFDLYAVRTPYAQVTIDRVKYPMSKFGGPIKRRPSMSNERTNIKLNPIGKNPGDLWTIPTQPFSEAHFATYPEKLCEMPIKAGCPQWICNKCGKPRERIVEPSEEYSKFLGKNFHNHKNDRKMGMSQPRNNQRPNAEYISIGFTDCGCGAGWRPGIILDPFIGSGTTGVVANKLARKWIGIELSSTYIKIAKKRLAQETLF